MIKYFFGLLFINQIIFAQPIQRPTNQFEVKIGWETNRKTIGGAAGYNIFLDDNVSVIPEIIVIIGFTGSASVQSHYQISSKLKLFGQVGLGATLKALNPVPTGIVALGGQLTINRKMSICLESRILLIRYSGEDWRTGGAFDFSEIKDVQKYPPIIFSIGFIF